MGFLFPKAPKPAPPPNPGIAAPTTNPFEAVAKANFIVGGSGSTSSAGRKPGMNKTSLIGG